MTKLTAYLLFVIQAIVFVWVEVWDDPATVSLAQMTNSILTINENRLNILVYIFAG